jgi:LPXTG-motif cell wall-anchored protein
MARAFVVAAVVLLGVAASTSTLSGGVDATNNEKVTICHATSSTTNPYTVNHINESSIDEQNNQYLNGHGDHLGPIFPAPNWGDIIPAFRDFPGYNWTDAGRAIWNNGCVPPPVVEKVTPMEPTLVEPTCDAPGDVTINPVTGVVYTKTVNDDGSITVTATADDGYILTDGATTTWAYTQEQLAQLPDDHEECVASLPPTVVPPGEPTGTESTVDSMPTGGGAEAAAVPAAPTTLPNTGSETWTIFLIGLASLLTGAGLHRLSRRSA